MSTILLVASLIDTQYGSADLCDDNMYTGAPDCNLRSAWSFCQDNVSPGATCVLDLLPDKTYLMNPTYGSLAIGSGDNIQVNGNNAIISGSLDTAGEVSLPGFPYSTPVMRYTQSGEASTATSMMCVDGCVGQVLRFTACEEVYSGDPYIYLVNGNSSELLQSNDDSCGLASELSFTVADISEGCNSYCIYMGCYANGRCQYTMNAYSEADDTINFNTTVVSSDYWPMVYYTIATADATVNTANGGYTAAEGDVMTFSTMLYPNDPFVDTFLRLYVNNIEVASNDDFGDVFTSQITWTATEAGNYSLHAGCANSDSCSGTVSLEVMTANQLMVAKLFDPRFVTYQQDEVVVPVGEDWMDPIFAISNVTVSLFGSTAESATGQPYNGGALYLNGTGYFNVSEVYFTDNVAGFGGHVAVSLNPIGAVTIDNCTMVSGQAISGGSVYVDTNVTQFSMINSNVSLSSAGQGGGLFINELNPGVYVGACMFYLCTATGVGNGGAIYAGVGNINFVVENTLINMSTAVAGGGGIFLNSGNNNFTLTGSVVRDCNADQGGGLHVSYANDHVSVLESEFSGCTALMTNQGSYGGAVLVDDYNYNFTLVKSTLQGNEASFGGGLAALTNNVGIVFAGSLITNNTATIDGGGAYIMTNNTQVLSTDYQSFVGVATFASPHPYVSRVPVNGDVPFVIAWADVVVPNCTTFIIAMDSPMDINDFDKLLIYRGTSRWHETYPVLSTTGGVFWGINVPVSRIESCVNHSLYIVFQGPENSKLFTSKVPKYGLSLRVYPVIEAAQQTDYIRTDFEYNWARSGSGGGLMLWSQNPFPLVINTVFDSNRAKMYGGGLMMKNDNKGAAFQRVHFTRNTAVFDGGGMMISTVHSGVTFHHCQWVDNSAEGNGGGFAINTDNGVGTFRDYNNISFVHCHLEGNTALIGDGGAAYVGNGNVLHIQESNFSSNACNLGQGGAVFYGQKNDFKFTNVLMNYNYASQSGGALYLSRSNKAELLSVDIVSNFADTASGGGIYCSSYNQLYCSLCAFDRNQAATVGGAVALAENNKLKVASGVFSLNEAEGGGGLSSERTNTITLVSVTMSDNHATQMGGALFVQANSILLFSGQSSFVNNSADIAGGAIATLGSPVWNVTGDITYILASSPTASPTPGGTDDFMDDDNQYFSYQYYYQYGYYQYGYDDDMGYYGSYDYYYSSPSTDDPSTDDNFTVSSTFSAGHERGVGQEEHRRNREYGCKLSQAKAEMGAELADEENLVSIYPISFIGNRAERGSAVFMYAVVPSINVLVNMFFSANNASAGGTTFWLSGDNITTPPPGLDSDMNFWADNAAPYGPRYATQAVSMTGPESYSVQLYQQALTPGITFVLKDYYGQGIPMEDVTMVMVTPVSNSSQCLGREVVIGGTNTIGLGVIATNGSAVFDDLQVVCAPTGNLTLDFLAELGAAARFESLLASTYYINSQTRLHFRSCGEGEYTSAGQCVSCADGTYSLLANASECRSCLGESGVSFCSKNQVVLKAGFVRRYPTSNAVMECPFGPASCQGGNLTGMNSCSVGYTGELCAVCAPNYFPQQGACLKCEGASIFSPSLIAYLVIFMLIIIGSLVSAFLYYGYLRQDEEATKQRRAARAGAAMERVTDDFDSDDECDGDEVNENVMGTAGKSDADEEPEEPTAAYRLKVWLGAKKAAVEGVMGKVKIIVSTYQVISSTASVVDVKMPASFTKIMETMNFVNLSIGTILPISCSETYTFIDSLYFVTLLPLAAAAILVCAFVREYSGVRRVIQANTNRQRGEKQKAFDEIKTKYLSFFFYLTFLVLPSTTITIFQTYLCTNVDPSGETPGGDNVYLTADMRISCTSDYYYGGLVFASVMVLVYPVGIPLMYLWMLYNARDEIKNRDKTVEEDLSVGKERIVVENPMLRERDVSRGSSVSTVSAASGAPLPPHSQYRQPSVLLGREGSTCSVLSLVGEDPTEEHTTVSPNTARLSFLWAPYSPEFWYWEVIETTRRLMLTAVLSVVEPGSAVQSVLSILLAQFFLKLYAYNVPYGKGCDNTLAEIGQYQIFFTFFAALIIQNGLLNDTWNVGLGVFLVISNLGVVFYCFGLELDKHEEEMREWWAGYWSANPIPGPNGKDISGSDGKQTEDSSGDDVAYEDGVQMSNLSGKSATAVSADVV